ncbi:ATP-binding cassette domain-containing protein, partial [Laribacter hongkongensis]
MALIHLADASLTRSGASAPALAGLAFSVPAGETLAVWGGNGSGKTTLAHWLAGWVPELLVASTEGTATFDGMPLTGRRPADWATDIQYVG